MGKDIKIEECKEYREELVDLLIDVVEAGASIGFLRPLQRAVAKEYWEGVFDPDVIVYVATVNHKIVGTVQLQLCTKQNGQHRAEIAKLMTHPNYRKNGIARLLMEKAHETAQKMGRPLLTLDTREGDPSNLLYTSLGYVQAGRIPDYAMSENGKFDATIIYYKKFD